MASRRNERLEQMLAAPNAPSASSLPQDVILGIAQLDENDLIRLFRCVVFVTAARIEGVPDIEPSDDVMIAHIVNVLRKFESGLRKAMEESDE